jgi:hypothetical protein
MNKELIDKLFFYANNMDYYGLGSLVRDKALQDKYNSFSSNEEERDEDEFDKTLILVTKDIYQQVKEANLTDYMLEVGMKMEGDNQDTLLNFMPNYNLTVEQATNLLPKTNNIYLKAALISATHDSNYMKQCILDKTIRNDSVAVIELIKNTKDLAFMKKCFEDDDLIRYYMKTELLKEIGKLDINYVEDYITNNSDVSNNSLVKLIMDIGNEDYTKKCLTNSKLALNFNNKIALVNSIKDIDYCKKYVSKAIDDNININDIVPIISKIDDPLYVKGIINKYKDDLMTLAMKDLVVATKDSSLMKEFLVNYDDRLREIDKLEVVLALKDDAYFKDKYFPPLKDSDSKIDLPRDMTIGVEIEAKGVNYRGNILDFLAKEDGSLGNNSLEVVSPILHSSLEDSKKIYGICNILNKLECQVNNNCGGHVHIGANYLDDIPSYTTFLQLTGNCETPLYIISNKRGEITREGGVVSYAMPLSGKIEEATSKGTVQLDKEEDLERFVNKLKSIQQNRYSDINFFNVDNPHKNTIEFRLANGTIEAKTWIENINLFGGIVRAAKEISVIQKKMVKTEEEVTKIFYFNQINSDKTSEEDKLEALLNLSVPNSKEIYLKRYKENKILLDNNPSINRSIRDGVARKSLNIKKDKNRKNELNEMFNNSHESGDISHVR